MAIFSKWCIVALAVVLGGWMCFDGSHAFRTGNYVTPSSGPSAGKLGPWADLMRGVGISPHATGVKSAFLVLGAAWLLLAVGFAAGFDLAWLRPFGLVLGVLTLWYAPIGTVLALVELGLLYFAARA